jgi:hypothetical protein
LGIIEKKDKEKINDYEILVLKNFLKLMMKIRIGLILKIKSMIKKLILKSKIIKNWTFKMKIKLKMEKIINKNLKIYKIVYFNKILIKYR